MLRPFFIGTSIHFEPVKIGPVQKNPAGPMQGVVAKSSAVVLTASEADITVSFCPDESVIYAAPTPCTDPA